MAKNVVVILLPWKQCPTLKTLFAMALVRCIVTVAGSALPGYYDNNPDQQDATKKRDPDAFQNKSRISNMDRGSEFNDQGPDSFANRTLQDGASNLDSSGNLTGHGLGILHRLQESIMKANETDGSETLLKNPSGMGHVDSDFPGVMGSNLTARVNASIVKGNWSSNITVDIAKKKACMDEWTLGGSMYVIIMLSGLVGLGILFMLCSLLHKAEAYKAKNGNMEGGLLFDTKGGHLTTYDGNTAVPLL